MVPVDLVTLADLQAGVVTRDQALGHGLGRSAICRLVRDDVWRRVSPGIFLTAPVAPSWDALAWCGVLIGGGSSRLGGLAAAYLHGMTGQPPGPILVLVPANRAGPTVRGPWVFRRERPGARSPRTVGSPPRLTVEDTVLDLIAEARDAKTVVHWVTSAVQDRLTTPEQLRRAARRRRALPNRRALSVLIDDVAAGARSVLEIDYLRKVERRHGLPAGRRQDRQRGTEVDVYYDDYAMLVELDGRRGHTGAGRFRDMRRDNAAARQGLLTLRYGYADVHDRACEVAFEVGGILASRGWPGTVDRCDWCRAIFSLS
jgi:very-short-patch-repair endonuclease